MPVQRVIEDAEIAKIHKRELDRRKAEIEAAGIKRPSKEHLQQPRVQRLCDELRSLRLRIDNYSDALVMKAVAVRIKGWKAEVEKRRAELRQLIEAKPIDPS